MHEGSMAKRLFSTPFERKFLEGYRQLFSIREIEESRIVQIALGALLLSVFLGLSRWFYNESFSISAYVSNTYTCWPFFQDCGRWYFLQALPLGYTQTTIFMGLFGIMALIAYLIYRREWTFAHMLLMVLWLTKVGIMFGFSLQLAANYDYYDIVLLFVLLFLPYKLFFARLSFVLFYFLASTIKIHEGWILGSYFTTLQTGMPIFGNTIAPIMTNFVIGMQILGSWWLLSTNMYLQRIALVYFGLFHLYSGILVGFRYPTVAFVMLIVLFALDTKATRVGVPLTKRSLIGWYFVAFLFIAQFASVAIPGDQKLTLEGNYYGLFMFEANHQCVSRATVYYTNDTSEELVRQSMESTWRCDPYEFWFALHNRCERYERIDRIAWTFDHSINGNPFYRIVDVDDVCVLEYKAFTHNEWIQLPPEAQIVGYPRKNYFQ